MYNKNMKYEWNPEKNELLKRERNISFEQIVFHIMQGDVWKETDHPNQKQYPGQRVFFIIVEDYIYLVPHIIEEEYIFLKTIIPNRKATKAFREEGANEDG